MRYHVLFYQWKHRRVLTAHDTLRGTHLRSHQAAVSASIHIPAGERQLQADALVSQAATKIRDHQPGAAICGMDQRGKRLILPLSSERPSYVPTKAIRIRVRGANRDLVLAQERRPVGLDGSHSPEREGELHEYGNASRK